MVTDEAQSDYSKAGSEVTLTLQKLQTRSASRTHMAHFVLRVPFGAAGRSVSSA